MGETPRSGDMRSIFSPIWVGGGRKSQPQLVEMVQSGIEPPTSCGGGSEFYIDPRGRYRMECCRHILCTKCNSMGGIIRCRHRCRHYCVSLLTQSFIDHKSIKVCRHQFLFLIKRPESRPDSKAVMVCPGLLIVLYQSSKIDKELETRTCLGRDYCKHRVDPGGQLVLQ